MMLSQEEAMEIMNTAAQSVWPRTRVQRLSDEDLIFLHKTVLIMLDTVAAEIADREINT